MKAGGGGPRGPPPLVLAGVSRQKSHSSETFTDLDETTPSRGVLVETRSLPTRASKPMNRAVMTDVDVVEGRQFLLRRREGYLDYRWEHGAIAGMADAEEAVAAVDLIAGTQQLPLLVDMRRLKTLDREARSRFSEADSVTYLALLVDSPLSRVLANFFLAVSRPAVPTRLFTSEASAVAWLTETT